MVAERWEADSALGGWPGSASCDSLDDAHCSRADIGGDDALSVVGDIDHVGSILTRAEDPIDFAGCGIVTADRLGGLSRKPRLTRYKRKAMGTSERTQINGGQSFLADKIDDCEGIVSSATVV